MNSYVVVSLGGAVVLGVGLFTRNPALIVPGMGLSFFGGRGALSDFSLRPLAIVALAAVSYLIIGSREIIPQGVLVAGSILFTGVGFAILAMKQRS